MKIANRMIDVLRKGMKSVPSATGHWWCIALVFFSLNLKAQQNIIIDMMPIDGIPLTPANIFNYRVQASRSENVTVTGMIRYRGSDLSLSYSFNCSLKEGMNVLAQEPIRPQWKFSSAALQELFFTYNMLPSGTYQYCVTITPATTVVEMNKPVFEECLYYRPNDLFLINLVDPPDKSKLKEHNPLLAWVANYSFSNELTYRIRVAEIKQGQNPVTAVMRNQPVFVEKGLMQNSIVYPVYAKPLEVNQPYAWTVDAYYKGILLGGAETWQFIITDSQAVSGNGNRSYVDIKKESGVVMLTAPGSLKLKYVLDDAQRDSLHLELLSDKDKKCGLTPGILGAVYGDNRYSLDLANGAALKHKGIYTLVVRTKTRHEYKLTFQYLNPEFVK